MRRFTGHIAHYPRWLLFSIVATLLIAGISSGFLLLVQQSTKDEVWQSLFENAKSQQIRTTSIIAGKLSSDLNSVIARLQTLALSQNLQQGDFTSDDTDKMLADQFNNLKSLYHVDALYILNTSNVVVNVNANQKQFIGVNMSNRPFVNETLQTKGPVISNGYRAADNSTRIAVTYPIINRHTGQFLGIVGMGMISMPFFSSYGNIYDFNSAQYINVLDRSGAFVASPNSEIVGLSFDSAKVQDDLVKHDGAANAFYHEVLSGETRSSVFDVGFGQRLVTGQPILVDNKVPVYFLTVGIPIDLIYSDINGILAAQNDLNFIELVGVIIATSAILVFLLRTNNRLNVTVKERTKELVNSYAQLESANEQLKDHDKLQTEFVNTAAHELRTPIQPILGLAGILQSRIESQEDRRRRMAEISFGEIGLLERNARRLQKLSAEILDASRIESGTLKLDKELVDINEQVRGVIADIVSWVPQNQRTVEIQFVPSSSSSSSSDGNGDGGNDDNNGAITTTAAASRPTPLLVSVDRLRIFEVLSNLVRNAIKFSEQSGGGMIKVMVATEKREDDDAVLVSIKDRGSGISEDVLPRLFSKFSTDSKRGGTGLGLFIAKNIIQAHGGKIWAENNKDGKGATFAFTLPLERP